MCPPCVLRPANTSLLACCTHTPRLMQEAGFAQAYALPWRQRAIWEKRGNWGAHDAVGGAVRRHTAPSPRHRPRHRATADARSHAHDPALACLLHLSVAAAHTEVEHCFRVQSTLSQANASSPPCTHTPTRTYTHKHTRTRTRMRPHIHIHTHTCKHTCKHTCTGTRTRTRTFTRATRTHTRTRVQEWTKWRAPS